MNSTTRIQEFKGQKFNTILTKLDYSVKYNQEFGRELSLANEKTGDSITIYFSFIEGVTGSYDFNVKHNLDTDIQERRWPDFKFEIIKNEISIIDFVVTEHSSIDLTSISIITTGGCITIETTSTNNKSNLKIQNTKTYF